MKSWTPLMWIYLFFALAGMIVPWYFNIQYILHGEESLTFLRMFEHGMATPLTSSLTTDLLIGATPFVIWMMVEAKRLQMKYSLLYIVATLLIAFAFACPFFLLMREIKLQESKN